MMSRNASGAVSIPEPHVSQIAFASPRLAWFWLTVRLYVGWEWLQAGAAKVGAPVWTGGNAGDAVRGFVAGALQKTAGAHPDVAGWYVSFLSNAVLPHAAFFSYLVAYGEVAVGAALCLGAFTGIAAFFGAFMNMNYLFAGTVSSNPLLFLLELFLILAWRVAGWWGLDRLVLPLAGTPWRPGTLFRQTPPE